MPAQKADFGRYGKSFQEGLVQLIFQDRPFADQITEVLDTEVLAKFNRKDQIYLLYKLYHIPIQISIRQLSNKDIMNNIDTLIEDIIQYYNNKHYLS